MAAASSGVSAALMPPALPRAACVDLRLDHHPASQLAGYIGGLFGGLGGSALGHGDSVLGEQALGLEFVNLHLKLLRLSGDNHSREGGYCP